jgi:hypothetical protein
VRAAQRITGAILLLFGLAAAFWIVPAQTEPGFGGAGALPPSFMPTAGALTLAIFGALIALTGGGDPRQAPSPFADPAWRRGAIGLALLLLCGLIFAHVSALLALAMLAVLAMVLLGERRPIMLLAMAGGVAAFFHLFVERLLGNTLP